MTTLRERMGIKFWANIEGTDAVGKTGVVRRLRERLSALPGVATVDFPEFSATEAGDTLRDLINRKTFVRLGAGEPMPIAETALLISDFAAKFEGLNLPNPGESRILITDRGPETFFVYQILRLVRSYGQREEFLKWVSTALSPIGKPDLTIVLHTEEDEIRRRLVEERQEKISEEDFSFISAAQREFLRLVKASELPGRRVAIANSRGELEKTLDEVWLAFESAVKPSI